MADLFGRPDISDLGMDKLLNKSGAASSSLPDLQNLIPDVPPSPVQGSPVTQALPSESVISGSFADILFANKKTFTDATPQGYRMGIDPVDHTFKWVIGSSVAQVDFGVTTANVMTFTVSGNPGSSNAIRINDASTSNWPAVDIRRSVGTGSGVYIQSDSPSGYCLDVLQKSNTPGIHAISNGSGSSVVPAQLENDTATNTNFYKILNLRGGSSPDVSLDIWAGNNANPNGTLTGQKGSILPSSDGNLYLNTDGGTTWVSVLTSSSVLAKEMVISTDFAASGRYGTNASGGGVTYDQYGANVSSHVGANGLYDIYWGINYNSYIYKGNPSFSCSASFSNDGAQNGNEGTWVMGSLTGGGPGHTFTQKHIGFKAVRESGTTNVYASQADGTTETSSLLTTTILGDTFDFIVTTVSDTSATYYYRKNGGSLSSGTTLTTHLPASSTNDSLITFGAANQAIGGNVIWTFSGATYRR